MTIEDESEKISTGDAVHIPANLKHGIKNIGNELLQYLTANSPLFAKEYEDKLWPQAPTD